MALYFLCALVVLGQNALESPPATRPLVLGFLADGSDLPNAPVLMEDLRGRLEGNARLTTAMATAHFKNFVLSPCDGPRDMSQRLGIGEFDLAFATAIVYARQPRQSRPYTPILQTWLPGDFAPPGRQAGVSRRGVIFAGPSSPLFTLPNLMSPEARNRMRAELTRGPLAVTSSEGAAGYIFPRLKLMRDLKIQHTPFWFCWTDSEVIKHVVSGLAPLGACRKGEIAALLNQEERPLCIRELFETDPFPTDPILLRNELLPLRNQLGSELKPALVEFFNVSAKTTNGLRMADASPEDYERLIGILAEMDRVEAGTE